MEPRERVCETGAADGLVGRAGPTLHAMTATAGLDMRDYDDWTRSFKIERSSSMLLSSGSAGRLARDAGVNPNARPNVRTISALSRHT